MGFDSENFIRRFSHQSPNQRRKLQKTTTYQADVSKNHHYTKMFQKTTTLRLTSNKKH
jgi:hypothetical protein